MTVLAKLRRWVHPVTMTLVVVAALTAATPFSAVAKSVVVGMTHQESQRGDHCEAMSRDNTGTAQVASQAAEVQVGHLHSSGADQGNCCETDCHCPSISGGHALSPFNIVSIDLSAGAPEYPPAPVLNGCRPTELLRPPI